NDGDAYDDHQTVGAGDVRAPPEGALYDREEREQKQRDREGADRENEPDFFAEEIGQNQAAEVHAAPPASAPWRSWLPSTSRPFSRCSSRSASLATTGSWVTIRTVLPNSRTRRMIKLMISSSLLRSRSPVGSSQSRKVGSATM